MALVALVTTMHDSRGVEGRSATRRLDRHVPDRGRVHSFITRTRARRTDISDIGCCRTLATGSG